MYFLAVECLSNKYWFLKNNPPLVYAYWDTRKYEENIRELNNISIYNYEYDVLQQTYHIIIPKYTENSIVNQKLVLSILEKYNDFNYIYTDGSKNTQGTGCAIYIPQQNMKEVHRLHYKASIYTAEAFAIERALNYIKQYKSRKTVIITDSQSVLDSIKNLSVKQKNTTIYNIVNLHHQIIKNKQEVIFLWVKGHSGIDGNEIVDKLARSFDILTPLSWLELGDMRVSFKKEMREQWESDWLKFAATSNNQYTNIHPILPQKIPHIDGNYSRTFSLTISRLKINHTRCPTHLKKIGITRSDICKCNNYSNADLNHLIFNCSDYNIEREQFITALIHEKVPFPTNIECLMEMQRDSINKIVYNFIKTAQIVI